MSLLAHFDNLGLKSPLREQKRPTIHLQESSSDSVLQQNVNAENGKDILASHTKNSTALEAQFVTPQIRSFSVQRRPRDLCSTQSQKTKSAIVNEFRSQKVLFQTPMAMSRVPICMQNDSISLSLCDTINEGGTPSTAEKTPQCASENKSKDTARSKKSLEGAFLEASTEQKAKTETITSVMTTTRDKSTLVHINNASYVIINKLGCGGSSSVYLAKREDNGKECALKVN